MFLKTGNKAMEKTRIKKSNSRKDAKAGEIKMQDRGSGLRTLPLSN